MTIGRLGCAKRLAMSIATAVWVSITYPVCLKVDLIVSRHLSSEVKSALKMVDSSFLRSSEI